MIRITGGEAKGRRIKSPPGRKTRPILASIRKVLFDTLGERVWKASFLDVFGGVGTVGIEALSRGADFVVYVEKDPRMVRLIRENLEILGYQDRALVVKGDAFRPPAILSEKGPYDIVFLGPPYGIRGLERLPLIYAGYLSEDGVMVLQHHHKSRFDFPEGFTVKEKRIGENQLTFFERRGL